MPKWWNTLRTKVTKKNIKAQAQAAVQRARAAGQYLTNKAMRRTRLTPLVSAHKVTRDAIKVFKNDSYEFLLLKQYSANKLFLAVAHRDAKDERESVLDKLKGLEPAIQAHIKQMHDLKKTGALNNNTPIEKARKVGELLKTLINALTTIESDMANNDEYIKNNFSYISNADKKKLEDIAKASAQLFDQDKKKDFSNIPAPAKLGFKNTLKRLFGRAGTTSTQKRTSGAKKDVNPVPVVASQNKITADNLITQIKSIESGITRYTTSPVKTSKEYEEFMELIDFIRTRIDEISKTIEGMTDEDAITTVVPKLDNLNEKMKRVLSINLTQASQQDLYPKLPIGNFKRLFIDLDNISYDFINGKAKPPAEVYTVPNIQKLIKITNEVITEIKKIKKYNTDYTETAKYYKNKIYNKLSDLHNQFVINALNFDITEVELMPFNVLFNSLPTQI